MIQVITSLKICYDHLTDGIVKYLWQPGQLHHDTKLRAFNRDEQEPRHRFRGRHLTITAGPLLASVGQDLPLKGKLDFNSTEEKEDVYTDYLLVIEII